MDGRLSGTISRFVLPSQASVYLGLYHVQEREATQRQNSDNHSVSAYVHDHRQRCFLGKLFKEGVLKN